MKTNQPLFWLAVVVFGLIRTEAQGDEVAVVKDNHVNVRGQPSLTSEVITQLQKGEKVVVLEEIAGGKTKKEPAKWARIQLPANTPVWAYASFVDPNNKTVAVSRLNLRAGPGENYSVVGRLERGEPVKEIRTVQGWMEIEAPEKAYAFVAAEYLSRSETPVPSVAASPQKTEVAPPPPKTGPEQTPAPVETVKTENPRPVANDQATSGTTATLRTETLQPPTQLVPASSPAIKETPPATSDPATSNPVSTPVAPPPNAAPPAPQAIVPAETAAPTPAETGPPPKRVVRREGIVRSTKSIQAPTYFELIGADSGKAINYLHTTDPELKLKDFKGKKIVVTGEEGIDSRWPNTPVLEVETIELAP